MNEKAHTEFSFKVWDESRRCMFVSTLDYLVSLSGELQEFYGDGNICSCEAGYKILRCTNLKDINDKHIYDGDIVKGNYKHDYGYAPVIGVMRWRLPVLFLTSNTEKGLLYHAVDHRFRDEFPELEIIGNIYENPELIQEGSEK